MNGCVEGTINLQYFSKSLQERCSIHVNDQSEGVMRVNVCYRSQYLHSELLYLPIKFDCSKLQFHVGLQLLTPGLYLFNNKQMKLHI